MECWSSAKRIDIVIFNTPILHCSLIVSPQPRVYSNLVLPFNEFDDI